MHTPIKLLLWLVAGTGALLAVLLALLFFVDVNQYRERIEHHVSTVFGREVFLEGPLSLEPSLAPRFVVNGLRIANPDWASRPFLAEVDKFDIRVNLLPLLRGELQIDSLEFHGVDLRLEKNAAGENNYTFGESGDPTTLPAIGHMLLDQATIAYQSSGQPERRVHMDRVTARKIPGQPVELEVDTTVNTVPVSLSLRGEPPASTNADGRWQITLQGRAADLSLRAQGSVADPGDWRHGEFQLDLQGREPGAFEALSGYGLPWTGAYSLGANIRFALEEYLTLSGITAQLADSDLSGELHWDMGGSPSAIDLRLESQQLHAGDFGFGAPSADQPDQIDTGFLQQPIDSSVLGRVALDIDVRVRQLTGLETPVQDIAVVASADEQHLVIEDLDATLADTQFTGKATLPWGERLKTLSPGSVSPETLLLHTELDIHAQASDAIFRYTTTLAGEPFELAFSGIEATARPGEAVTLRGEATLNDKPVNVRLQGEPLAMLAQQPAGPWRDLTLEVRDEAIQISASGSVDRPLLLEGFAIDYELGGPEIDFLLPLQGAWTLKGRYEDYPNRHVFDALQMTLGRSDIGGRIVVDQEGERPVIEARLNAGRLRLGDLQAGGDDGTAATAGLDQPLDINALTAMDLDVELRMRQLAGLTKPLQDILLAAKADARQLVLAPVRFSIEGSQLEARLQLPWGNRLAAPGKKDVTIRSLLSSADLTVQAQLPEGKFRHETVLMGHPVILELTGLEATAGPDERVQVSARTTLDETPLQVALEMQPLAVLLQHPAGPWNDLSMEIDADKMYFKATGSVQRPFEASGFDTRFALRGDEIGALLPITDFILPLGGGYALTGHFADLPDRTVFDDLQIQSGRSDLAGSLVIHQGEERPRVILNFQSEQVYLGELLPVTETEAQTGAKQRVIPDYELPIERMREVDGEIHFKGNRLRTAAGDLGDIQFTATLQDGIFRLDPFRVRGWAGARIATELTIDLRQEPPVNKLTWTARQLDYGVLLKQADFAETVEGHIDVTLRLDGTGGSRREFLGTASGQLIIVGQEGRFGSRRLDLWGASLITTMLSREWHQQDVTELNCIVARVDIEDGIARSDDLLIDTSRITIGAAGTLDLDSEALNVVLAPSPKRATLLGLTNPVHVTGTLAAPEVNVTVLPRRRMSTLGTGALAGLVNPAYLLFTFSQLGTGHANSCAAAVEQAMAEKEDVLVPVEERPTPPPRRFSLLPGCTRPEQRRAE